MKFKKLISSALLFFAAIFNIAPAHADYAATFTTPAVKPQITISATIPAPAANYAASFVTTPSSFSTLKAFSLPTITATTPASTYKIPVIVPIKPAFSVYPVK